MKERETIPKEYLTPKEMSLFGKTALITGSSRDIGAEIARALAREGVSIIGNYRDKKKRADEVQKELNAIGIKSEFVQADITAEEGRDRLKEVVDNDFGSKLDILVLNASGPTVDINVNAANKLIDILLSKMSRGSVIVLMQSIPGHFEPQLRGLNLIPDIYLPVAKAKYQGEQSIRSRINEFEEKGILFVVICPPEVVDTYNIKVFKRLYDSQLSEKLAMISDKLSLPKTVTKEQVGKKVAEILKKRNLSIGYTEFFKE